MVKLAGRLMIVALCATIATMILVARADAAGYTVVTKAADESVVSSTVDQNDDELFFTATSGTNYEVDVGLRFASPVGGTTPDLKLDVGEDAANRGFCFGVGMRASDSTASGLVGFTDQTATWGFATPGSGDRIAELRCIQLGGGGTFRVRWSQNTSNAGATIVRAGSYLRYVVAGGDLAGVTGPTGATGPSGPSGPAGAGGGGFTSEDSTNLDTLAAASIDTRHLTGWAVGILLGFVAVGALWFTFGRTPTGLTGR
jgi:hypothetical protein